MKNSLSLLFFLLFSVSLVAQMSLGLKIQQGEAWENYGDETDINGLDQRVDHYGISLEFFYDFSPHLSLGAAPGYVSRGAACRPNFDAGGLFFLPIKDVAIYTNYLQLPILLKGALPLSRRFSVYGQTGAGFSYLLDGYREITFWDSVNVEPEQQELNFKEENALNRFDFAAQVGLGFAYQMGRSSFQLSADYYHSFLNTTEVNTSENRSWSVGLGYAIKIKK